jgi:uncharacterized protein
VPLALENIAALINWPGEEMTEGQFLYDLVDRTGVRLLIDVANLHTNHVNRGEDPAKALDELPVEAIAYVHVAGGFERDGVWHDSHAHPVPPQVLDVLAELASRVSPPGVLLERDENFPEPAELERELDAIRGVLKTAGDQGGAPASDEPATTPTTTPATAPATSAESSAGSGAAATPATSAQSAAGSAPAAEPVTSAEEVPGGESEPVARQRTGLAQAALLSALVAGTPAPEGFDRVRLAVQSRALAAKRADVVGKVAPELPVILGTSYRPAFVAYAQGHPMTDGYRRDALSFAEHLLLGDRVEDAGTRRALRAWWLERSGPAPLSRRPTARLARATRRVLLRR